MMGTYEEEKLQQMVWFLFNAKLDYGIYFLESQDDKLKRCLANV